MMHTVPRDRKGGKRLELWAGMYFVSDEPFWEYSGVYTSLMMDQHANSRLSL